MSIVTQRCLIHENREAIARCPSCRQFFCRECVTEHEQKFVCASCFRKNAVQTKSRSSPLRWVIPSFQIVVGLIAAWIFFYALGEILIQVPIGIRSQFRTSGSVGPLPVPTLA
jgi:hypothetical protein